MEQLKNMLAEIQSLQTISPNSAALKGVSRYYLQKMTEQGLLEKIGHGLYTTTKEEDEEYSYTVATSLVGTPSAICLVSALAYHHLTDLIPKKTWIMVEASKRSAYESLRLVRKRSPRWKAGIDRKDTYAVTNIERTIVDALTNPSIVGINVGIEALKTALKKKVTTLSKIVEMAKALSVYHRVKPYVEALA